MNEILQALRDKKINQRTARAMLEADESITLDALQEASRLKSPSRHLCIVTLVGNVFYEQTTQS